MDNEKLFQYLVSRVQVRESSTLTIASIASSASIILWGLYLSLIYSDIEIDLEFARVVGIILPILGYAYFEISFTTQQRWDYDEITRMIKEDTPSDKQDDLKKIIFGQNRDLVIPKMVIWRILLALPIIGWCSTLGAPYVVISILFTGIAIILLVGGAE